MDIETVEESSRYDSENEAYDPWPGAIFTETGCHTLCYYREEYKFTAALTSFFNLDPKGRYSKNQFEKLISEYAEKHNGFIIETTKYCSTHKKGLVYDEALWKVLELPENKEFRIYHFEKILYKLCKHDPKPKGCGTYLEDLEDLEPNIYAPIISECLNKMNSEK